MTMTERRRVYESGTGRVVRVGDLVRVNGLRGRWLVTERQPFAEAVQVYAVGTSGRWTGGVRFVAADRLHVRRTATAARFQPEEG